MSEFFVDSVFLNKISLLPGIREIELGISNQEPSSSAGKSTRVVLVSCCTWKCDLKAISSSVDISKVRGSHLLWQMSSQWGSQKLLQRLVSYELTAYLFYFVTQWTMAILSCTPDNTESHKPFDQIFLSGNVSLNQTLLTLLLYVRQTWMTQLILVVSMWGIIFL